MDALVDLILNGSTELDAPAIVRLIVVVMALELFSVLPFPHAIHTPP